MIKKLCGFPNNNTFINKNQLNKSLKIFMKCKTKISINNNTFTIKILPRRSDYVY